MTKEIEIHKKKEIDLSKDRETDRVMFESLNKGIYDLDFAIGICKKILETCHKYKASSDHNLAFTLSRSLESLIGYLETQKCGVDRDPYVELFCTQCGQKERVFKGDVSEWKKCKKCTPKIGCK